jgi:type IV secretory pathway TraG/TraD family ATPase VirD4
MRLAPSPAAQYQAAKTRLHLALQLFSQLLFWLLIVWVSLTTWVVWHDVGVYLPGLDHIYFGRWIWCSILTETPWLRACDGWLKIPLGDTYYPLAIASAWLSGPQVYRTDFYNACWYAARHGWGLAADLVPLSFVALLMRWRWRQDTAGGEHLRGMRLLTPRQLNREMHGRALQHYLYGPPRGLKLGEIIIPERMEFEHMLVTGNPGSGKSTTIREALEQIAERDQPAIVIDPESEYLRQFFSPERGDWVLNPLDLRCPRWNPWAELRDEFFTVDAAAMAASLIRGRPRNESEKFFQDSTRTVVESILHVARDDADVHSLLNLVSMPREDLHEALQGTPAYPLIDPGAREQGAGILGTAVNAIKTFVYLPPRSENSRAFSCREWVEGRRGWLFMPSREDIREAIQLLQGLWLDLLVRWLMSADIGSDQTWVVADELASLGHQPQIEKLLTRGRKRGLAVILGLQNVSQLQALYGQEGCVTLTSSPSTKLIMRVDEPKTTQTCSDLIGKHEIERLQMTQLAGLSTYREGVNLSPQRDIEVLVLPDEIKLMKPFTGYLCIAGHPRTKIHIPESHMVEHYPAFIPRPMRANRNSPVNVTPEPTDAEIAAALLARPEVSNG